MIRVIVEVDDVDIRSKWVMVEVEGREGYFDREMRSLDLRLKRSWN